PRAPDGRNNLVPAAITDPEEPGMGVKDVARRQRAHFQTIDRDGEGRLEERRTKANVERALDDKVQPSATAAVAKHARLLSEPSNRRLQLKPAETRLGDYLAATSKVRPDIGWLWRTGARRGPDVSETFLTRYVRKDPLPADAKNYVYLWLPGWINKHVPG